jgi:hypothetical protein
MLLFGGLDHDGHALSDTWLWDGADWNRLSPAHSPSARWACAMAYDPDHEQVILFGGLDPSTHELGDTWTWDGQDWSQLPVSGGASPEPRDHAGMAYDSEIKKLLLISGHVDNMRAIDTWSWEGQGWKRIDNSEFHIQDVFTKLNPEQSTRALLVNADESLFWIPAERPLA